MKKIKQFLLLTFMVFTMILGCSKDDDNVAMADPIQKEEPKEPDTPDNPETPTSGQFQMVDVQMILPLDSEIEVENTTLFTLASVAEINTNGIGNVPFNPQTAQLAYLMDGDNNLLLAGFLTDERKEISTTTTAEVLLYFGLGYQLLADNIKLPYINAVKNVDGFSNFITDIEALFESNPLMYTEGAYENILNAKIDEITARETIDISARIDVDSGDARSGITITEVDASNIQVQNSYPRRAHTFVYKKSFTDENGNETQISNYTANPVADFELKPGSIATGITDGGSVTAFQKCNAASASTDNTTVSENINLPVSEDELSADYEVVVVGPGTASGEDNGRNFTSTERAKFEELSKEAFILDNFLPTLLDIGGNKGLLPPFGDAKEGALVNAVLPYLEANPNVLEKVLLNDFDGASKEFIPFLYEDIRQSNDLREILKDVYDIVDGGSSPYTFIQGQELIETGEARYKALTSIIDKNINSSDNECGNYRKNDAAKIESWIVKSAQGKVNVGPECLNIMLKEVGDITVAATVDLEAGQTLEYDWNTSGTFGGRIQDINGDSSNFGTTISTTAETVSFSSVALESDLSDGNNIENVTVTAFVKNSDGSRSEVGSAQMKVNIQKQSFYITPSDACIEGGRNVVLRVKHNNNDINIPNENTDYKLVWKTTAKYGQLRGRNSVETTYNDEMMIYQSQDEEVERGVDEVSVAIYGRPKGSSENYSLLDTEEATVTTKNDPNCDTELYTLVKEFSEPPTDANCEDGVGTAYQGRIVVNVPKDDDATKYTVEWSEVFIASQNFEFNRPPISWTNENMDTAVVTLSDDGKSFRVYSGVGNGAACSNSSNVGDLRSYINGIDGYATFTVCYD